MDKLLLQAFNNELEKTALLEKILPALKNILEALPKIKPITKLTNVVGEAGEAVASGGGESLITNLKQYADPKFVNLPNNKIQMIKPTTEATEEFVAANNGMLSKSFGNMFTRFDDLKKGITNANTLGQNASQLGTNVTKSLKDNWLASGLRYESAKDLNLISKDGKFFVKGKGLMGDREVLNDFTVDELGKPIGNIIFKNRKPMKLLKWSMTPEGFATTGAATTIAMGGSTEEGIKDGVKNGLLFSTPLGELSIIKDVSEMGYNAIKSIF